MRQGAAPGSRGNRSAGRAWFRRLEGAGELVPADSPLSSGCPTCAASSTAAGGCSGPRSLEACPQVPGVFRDGLDQFFEAAGGALGSFGCGVGAAVVADAGVVDRLAGEGVHFLCGVLDLLRSGRGVHAVCPGWVRLRRRRAARLSLRADGVLASAWRVNRGAERSVAASAAPAAAGAGFGGQQAAGGALADTFLTGIPRHGTRTETVRVNMHRSSSPLLARSWKPRRTAAPADLSQCLVPNPPELAYLQATWCR